MKVSINEVKEKVESTGKNVLSKKELFKILDGFNSVENTLESNGLLVDTQTKIIHFKGEKIKLSPQHFALVVYFIQNKNTTLSREKILKEAWLNPLVYERTVDVHIHFLRQRFDKSFIKSWSGYGFEWVEE